MKLASRMNLVVVLVVAVLVAGFSLVFRYVVLQSFLELDERGAVETMERARAALEREISHLNRFVHDWSSWDDTYGFIVDRNRGYIESNFTDDVFRDQKMNLIHVFDVSGRRVWGRTVDASLERTVEIDLSRELDPGTFRAIVKQDDPDRSVCGIIMTSIGPMMVSSNPILTSSNKGPSRGAFVMGRLITDDTMKILSEQAGVSVTWTLMSDPSVTRDARMALDAGNPVYRDMHVKPSSGVTLVHAVVRDVSGRPCIVLGGGIPRSIAGKGRWVYTLGLATLLGIGFTVVTVVSLMLRSSVIQPIEDLTRLVLRARESRIEDWRTKTGRNDEIGVLEKEFASLFTSLVKSTKELETAEKRIRQVIEFLPDATFAMDKDGVVIAWNRAMEEMSGITKEDIVGMDHCLAAMAFYGKPGPVLADVLLGRGEEIRQRYDISADQGNRVSAESFASKLYGGRGAHLWIVASPLYDENGELSGAIECVRDISDEKRSREVLKRLGQTVEQLLDGVLITDLEGKITYMNPSWAAMHRCVPEDGIGGHVGVFHTEDQMVSEVGPFLADVMSKGSARATVGHVTKDDEVFRTLSTAFVLKDDQARSTAIIWICRDITEELRLEEQLRQAQKMEVVGRLAGGVAHDLNNMLSPILGYAEIALAELDEGSPLYDDITQIRHAAERARNLTHELLAFSRKQVLDMKVTDLGDVVSGYAKMLRRTIREDISISINRNLCTKAVKVDVGRMGQILMNLAVNAQDAMPHGGVVTIETSQVTLDETYAHTHEGVRPGEYLVLGFSDTGTGIDRKVKEHIFEPFFTTKDTGKGTGLGLATVYGIVRQHGGHISVYSEPGMGTTFRIYLPAVNHAENGTSDSAEPAPVAVGKETIAVAEDDPHVRALACEILRKHGYSVVTAEKSDELVEKLQGCIETIDLLLTDVIMPDLNGRELFEKLRGSKPDLKVVYMSGYTGDIIARHGILEKGVHLVQKPFTMGSLTQTIRRVLDA